MRDDIRHRSFRVPRTDRSLLAIPSLETGLAQVTVNRELFETQNCNLNGRSLTDLRRSIRRDVLTAARAFTSSLIGENVPVEENISESILRSLVVTGHQPELFHVGVWAKNFALAGVALQSQSTALNLIIDNDTITDPFVRIPVRSNRDLRTERISFGGPYFAQPWEEARIRDQDEFQRFGNAVRDRMRSMWNFEPLVGAYWNTAIKQSHVSERLCDTFTALRVSVERNWGQQNLELPMSQLCMMEPFLWFISHLLMRLPQVHSIFNATVNDYRHLHHVRSRTQPVPNLESVDDWLEAPFWIWQRGDLQRGRLFGRRAGGFCELRNEKEVVARLPWTEDGSLDGSIAVLAELQSRGYRLRTRALTTTLFARLFLADLFVHGIGGAKYDEMTDQLCERVFGLTAPKFLTVSGTLYLPLGKSYDSTEKDLREVKHELRDLKYNPDRHLSNSTEVEKLAREKSGILAEASQLRGSNQLRGRLTADQHRHLNVVNSKLRMLTNTVQAAYEAERMKVESELAANSLIRNREYSFILYPEEQVSRFLTPLSTANSQRIGEDPKQPLDNGPQNHLA